MKAGQVVLVAPEACGALGGDRTVAVVSRIETDTMARILIWTPRRGRWLEPIRVLIDKLSAADDEWNETKTAKANIRRHHGLIPYGGTVMRYTRVWPDGKEPDTKGTP